MTAFWRSGYVRMQPQKITTPSELNVRLDFESLFGFPEFELCLIEVISLHYSMQMTVDSCFRVYARDLYIFNRNQTGSESQSVDIQAYIHHGFIQFGL